MCTYKNTVLLIGNGFDLAHGMETSYDSFIQNFIQSYIDAITGDNLRSEGFINVNKYKLNNDLISKLDVGLFRNLLNTTGSGIQCSNEFIKQIINKSITNWSGIEGEYYALIRDEADTIFKNGKISNISNKVDRINDGFQYIKERLISYLKDIEGGYTPHAYHMPFRDLMNRYANEHLNVLCVNFNYTQTYKVYGVHNEWQIEQVHGTLENTEENPVIFGYGDTNDSFYNKIEELDDNRFLRFSKMRDYTINGAFNRISAWLDEHDNINVKIIGMSCGTTDRVLLNNILEHPNCKFIDVHYYNSKDDFLNISANIIRCFKDKQLYGRRIIFNKRNKY